MFLASRCPLALQEASIRLQETGIISFTRQEQKSVKITHLNSSQRVKDTLKRMCDNRLHSLKRTRVQDKLYLC